MKGEELLLNLRNRIPKFTCGLTQCNQCCGPVPMSKIEKERIRKKYKKDPDYQVGQDLKCNYITDKGCSIYEERPILCRLFGCSDVETLKCPYGMISPDFLTIKETEEVMKMYKELMNLSPYNSTGE